jgi:predicted nucleic acid-binding protein
LTYADSGFIVSLYRPTEQLSGTARRTIDKVPLPIVITPLSLLEIRNALNQSIQRGEISTDQRDAVLENINTQAANGFFRLADVSQAAIHLKAGELSDKYTPRIMTRSLDLLHVAAALLSKSSHFLSTDKRQRQAAEAEGLTVRP